MINKILEKLYNFVETDESVKKDFEEYKNTMGIKNTPKSSMKEFYIPYIFERKLPNEDKTIPELFFKKAKLTDEEKKTAKSFFNIQSSIYEVKKVFKDGFELYNVVNEKKYEVIAIHKMTEYRGIGVGQYVVARIIEFLGKYYLIEISGRLAANKKIDAIRYAMAKIIEKPSLVYKDNKEKQKQIEAGIASMYEKFVECFNSDEVVTTNKCADDVIEMFNEFVETGKEIDFGDKLQEPESFGFFDIKELHKTGDFMQNPMKGFSSHKQIYDVGIIFDKSAGLFVIPFYKTFCKILESKNPEKIKNYEQCVQYFLKSESVPKTILERLANKFSKFVDLVNEVTRETLSLDKMLKKYKKDFAYSTTSILYNSDVFSNTLDVWDEQENENLSKDYSKVGRNDKCPCGSGKKYKQCCMK